MDREESEVRLLHSTFQDPPLGPQSNGATRGSAPGNNNSFHTFFAHRLTEICNFAKYHYAIHRNLRSLLLLETGVIELKL